MRISDFDYELPEELIAQYPAERRDESRMLMLDRSRGEVREAKFATSSSVSGMSKFRSFCW